MATGTGVRATPQSHLPSASKMFLVGALAIATTTSGVPPAPNKTVIVASSNGLWSPSQPLTISPTVSSTGLEREKETTPITRAVSSAAQVAELRETSGLSIDQLGRLFGVSRRSIHNWINGKQMVPRHEERLSYLLQVIGKIPGGTPTEKRAHLLANDESGSVFHRLLAEVSPDATLQVNALSPKELLEL